MAKKPTSPPAQPGKLDDHNHPDWSQRERIKNGVPPTQDILNPPPPPTTIDSTDTSVPTTE